MYTLDKDCKREDKCVGNGKGEVHLKHLTNAEGLYGHGRMFGHITIDPGCSIGYHTHNHETEFYYIIKGEGVFSNNGEEVILRAGDIGATGYGEGHALENRTNEPLEMIALIVME